MKNLTLQFIALSLLLNACASSQIVLKRPTWRERIRVAVMPFNDAPHAPGSGKIATEAMNMYLLEIPNYDVVERGRLEEILKNQNIQNTETIDFKTLESLGKLLKVDAFVIGAVTYYQEKRLCIFPPAKTTVTARMVQTATETVEWSATNKSEWHPMKWGSSVILPLFAYYTFTSPTASDCIKESIKNIVDAVKNKN